MSGLNPVGENRPNKIFLSIANGRIRLKNRDTGEYSLYASLEGLLKGITTREFESSGTRIYVYDLTIQADDDIYVLSVNRSSGVARSLINALGSCKDFSKPIIIEPWEGEKKQASDKAFTNVNVYVGTKSKETRLSWSTTLPPLRKVNIAGKVYGDDSEIIPVLNNIIVKINAAIVGEDVASSPAKPTMDEQYRPEIPTVDSDDDLPF